MRLSVVAAVFPLVFLAELPDKTMFASLLMSTRGKPVAVWLGASAAFAVHVAIAVSVGVAAFRLLPHRVVEVVVGVLFAAGAAYSFLSRNAGEEAAEFKARSVGTVVTTSAAVIFVAEWGDLTQILTANLAADYHSWLGVGAGSLAALVAVAGLAVLSGSRVLGRVPVRGLRLATAALFTVLAAYTLGRAF